MYNRYLVQQMTQNLIIMKKLFSILVVLFVLVLGTKTAEAQIPTIKNEPAEIKLFSHEGSEKLKEGPVYKLEKKDEKKFKNFLLKNDQKTDFLAVYKTEQKKFVMFSANKNNIFEGYRYVFNKNRKLISKKKISPNEFRKWSNAVKFQIASK